MSDPKKHSSQGWVGNIGRFGGGDGIGLGLGMRGAKIHRPGTKQDEKFPAYHGRAMRRGSEWS